MHGRWMSEVVSQVTACGDSSKISHYGLIQALCRDTGSKRNDACFRVVQFAS